MANLENQLERKRVVITGLGAITPIGNTLETYWQGLMSGANGIDKISVFDASKHGSQIAGEVKGFDPLDYMDRKGREAFGSVCPFCHSRQ